MPPETMMLVRTMHILDTDDRNIHEASLMATSNALLGTVPA